MSQLTDNDNDHDRLIRIEGKLDLLLVADRDKEQRIRVLENNGHQAQGGMKVAAGMGGVAGAAAGYLLRKFL